MRAALAALSTALLVLIMVGPALAGPPVHPREPSRDIEGLNHACGAAVDSAGDVYAASPGESKIKVFEPADHDTPIAEISNANEPCGLAVDSRGDLLVSERASGEVVRYVPDAYPFEGAPTYGAREVIDASGEALGISVDPSVPITNSKRPIGGEDSLYVAKGNRIEAYGNERQRFKVSGSGTFAIVFEGEKTAPLAPSASHAEIQGALEALPAVGKGNVSVVTANFADNDHLVIFVRALGLTDTDPLEFDTSGLTGSVTPSENVQGGTIGTVGEGDLLEATGVAAYTNVASGENSDRHLFVADAATNEVKTFSGPNVAGLKLRKTIDGPKEGEEFGFGKAGAAVGVDWTSGHFFLYDDAHATVDEFQANGLLLDQATSPSFEDAEPTAIAVQPRRSEIQEIRVNATGGTYKLSFEGEETASLPFNASATAIQAALESLSAIGEGNVTVTGAGPYHIAFVEDLADDDVPELLADSTGLTGGSHSVVIVTEVGGSGPGSLYVSAGAGAGARLLAFGPLAAPARKPLPELSQVQAGARAVAVDSHGDVYLAAESTIYVFGPSGKALTSFEDKEKAYDLDIDSEGNLYVLDGAAKAERMTYYKPSVYPPVEGTGYTRHEPLLLEPQLGLQGLAVDPADDCVFVAGASPARIVRVCPEGSGEFASGLKSQFGSPLAIAVDAEDNVYLASNGKPIFVIDPTGSEIIARIAGTGAPGGALGSNPKIAVNQASGHVVSFEPGEAVREYEATGAYLGEFGSFTNAPGGFDVAIDNGSESPNKGNLYVAYDDPKGAYDLSAFGGLEYGERPTVVTDLATDLGAADATINGSVNPRGSQVENCYFEYLTDAEYGANIAVAEEEGHGEAAMEGYGFEGAETATCEPEATEIGDGSAPIAVHAIVTGISPETTRYRFRLLASNQFGESQGGPSLFGPPLLVPESALPVLYREATLRAKVDPSGLATSYRFEYGLDEGYGQSTPATELAPGDGSVLVEVPLGGLEEGTEYHFRVVAENEASSAVGPDQTLRTLVRRPAEDCPNASYRTGFSANLPDCRAYELVTPAETRGLIPYAAGTETASWGFDNKLVAPDGERLSYFVDGTLPGFDGNGLLDGYRAERAQGEGEHPNAGWTSALVSPSYAQTGGDNPGQLGVAPDQLYSVWRVIPLEAFGETLDEGTHLRTPDGFELLGQGSLGIDPQPEVRRLSAGGTHVIFTSGDHLEADAAPAPTVAIYDREAGDPTAEVLSVKPDGSPFDGGEGASFLAATEDGTAVAFEVGGILYLRRNGVTTEVAAGPNTFSGISEDGTRVFYADAGTQPAGLFVCDIEAGPCAGPGAHAATKIAASATFVNVSADGSHAFFTSEDALTPPTDENDNSEHAVEGAPNLYAWDGAATHFVANLDPGDLVEFDGDTHMHLGMWSTALVPGVFNGRGHSPARSTPDGKVFVFQSHARLTGYENESHGEIYRYEQDASEGERLTCPSCDPSGAPPSADALLQDLGGLFAVQARTLIPNLTEDGSELFFQSPDQLLPEDANGVQDVYAWRAMGAGSCESDGGCLSLISAGQGAHDSYLYGMSPDGHDVFFLALEQLVSSDTPDSPSLYDARENGGIPDPPVAEPCHGDACQGSGSTPLTLPALASTGAGAGNLQPRRVRCRKGKHRVKGRCVAKRHRKHRKHHRRHRARHNVGVSR
jgi:hypothetical protein